MNPHPSRIGRARRTDDEWESRKDEIRQLYIQERKTLEETRMIMESRGFVASRRQYVYRMARWDLSKYSSSNPMERPLSCSPRQSPAPVARGAVREGTPEAREWTLKNSADEVRGGGEGDHSNYGASNPSQAECRANALRETSCSTLTESVCSMEFGDDGRNDHKPPSNPSKPVSSTKGTSIEGLPCPYRLRNPVRFNVRDHRVCALHPFSDMALLKRHILTMHVLQEPKNKCPRCQRGFNRSYELQLHATVPDKEICDVKEKAPVDPEDGIDESIQSKLTARNARRKVSSWDDLWMLLFPQDMAIKSPHFTSVIEHHEIRERLDREIPLIVAAHLPHGHASPVSEEILKAVQALLASLTAPTRHGSPDDNAPREHEKSTGYSTVSSTSSLSSMASTSSGPPTEYSSEIPAGNSLPVFALAPTMRPESGFFNGNKGDIVGTATNMPQVLSCGSLNPGTTMENHWVPPFDPCLEMEVDSTPIQAHMYGLDPDCTVDTKTVHVKDEDVSEPLFGYEGHWFTVAAGS